MTKNHDPDPLPDHPRVPRPAASRLLRAYVGFAVAAGLGFVGANVFGVGFDESTARQTIPPSVRASPGGYRSYHFWHSGYSGGK